MAEFQDLVDQVFNKINLLNKWTKDDNESVGVSSGPRSRSTESSLVIPEPDRRSTESSLLVPEQDRRSTESSLLVPEPFRRFAESSLGIREPYIIRSTESSLVIPEPDLRSTELSLGIHELGMGSSGLSFVVPGDSLLSTETQTDEMLDFHLGIEKQLFFYYI